MPDRTRNKYYAGIAVCLGVIIALAVAELAGRAIHFLPLPPSAEYIKLTNAVGLLPDPSSRSLSDSPQREYTTWLDFNALGFRDPKTDFSDTSQKSGHLNIVALGDSYTSTWQVPLEQRWTEQMAYLHPGWSTLNLGQPGWGTDQEYLTYLNYPLSKPPDVALLMFYAGNDVSDNSRLLLTGTAPNHPYFVPKDTGDTNISIESFAALRLVNPWQYTNPFDVPGRLPFPSNIRAWLNLHSVVYRGASKAWSALHQPHQPTQGAAASPSENSATALPIELNVFNASVSDSAAWHEAWQITEALVQQMHVLAGSRGTRFVIVMAPYYAMVEPDLTPDYISNASVKLDFSLPYTHLTAFAKANNIPLLDLTPGFLQFYQSDPQHRALFFSVDRHFTPLGNCVAAVLITNWLDSTAHGDAKQCR